ncbi:MAG TPA: hypothetical protein VLA44_00970 [Clostridia bacterium]|nr:hypothetical protein [Clostridia bacterium]
MVCRFVMLEGIAAGELPTTLDVETRASAMADLLDGFVLEYLERGDEIRLTDLERRALLLLG